MRLAYNEVGNGYPMRTVLFAALLLAKLSAQPLPVVPMETDPDQIALSLRERKPLMPIADCNALDLWECHPEEPARVTDISLRWVRLDSGAELEAVLVAEAKAEMSFVAYVFDKGTTWNLVGKFFCRQERCDPNTLIRIQKLTEDSPPLLLCYRDLAGCGKTPFPSQNQLTKVRKLLIPRSTLSGSGLFSALRNPFSATC